MNAVLERSRPVSVVRSRDAEALICRRWGGLTLLQCAVLYVIGFHAEEDGVFRLPASKIQHFIGRGSGPSCVRIPHELEDFGLLEVIGGRGWVNHWRLTRLGQAVFRELAEE